MSYLRDYQIVGRDNTIKELSNGSRSTLLVYPTGTGKTETALDIIDHWPDKTCEVLCISHRQELVYQPHGRWLSKTGETAEIEMGEYGRSVNRTPSRVTFASKDSLHPKRLRRKFPDPKRVGLIWIDEAHHVSAANSSYQHILDYFLSANPDCRMFGCTATPDRSDRSALGRSFDTVAHEYPLLSADGPSAIGDGWLVPINQYYVQVHDLDFKKVTTTAGDFSAESLQQELFRSQALEKICGATREYGAGGKSTLAFAPKIDSAIKMAAIWNAEQPLSARAIVSSIPKDINYDFVINSADQDQRSYLLKAWRTGQFQYMANVAVFTEGMDAPQVRLLCMGRPTKSRSLYSQMLGRGCRILPNIIEGKDWRLDSRTERLAAIAESEKPAIDVLDFVGNHRHPLLINAVDILGGNYDQDVVRKAKDKIESGDVSVTEALTRVKRALEVELRSKWKATFKADYIKIDASTVLGTGAGPAYLRNRKPSIKQTEALIRLGVPKVDVLNLTFAQATVMMDKLIGSIKKKGATFKQRRILLQYRFNPDISFKEASATIDRIARSGWTLIGDG